MPFSCKFISVDSSASVPPRPFCHLSNYGAWILLPLSSSYPNFSKQLFTFSLISYTYIHIYVHIYYKVGSLYDREHGFWGVFFVWLVGFFLAVHGFLKAFKFLVCKLRIKKVRVAHFLLWTQRFPRVQPCYFKMLARALQHG